MRSVHPARAYLLALLLPLTGALVLASCQGENDSTVERRPLGEAATQESRDARASARREMSPEAAAQLDSGNAAYRAEEYERARTHYRRALDAEPGSNAAWFGVYMAESALGNEAAADSALERAGSLSGSRGMHPAPGDTTPEGPGPAHPPIPDSAADDQGG